MWPLPRHFVFLGGYMKKQLILILASACLMPLAALAQENPGPCRSDVEQFCRQSQGDPKAATDCLLDHQQEISDACYDKLKQQLNGSGKDGEARSGNGGACKQDVQRLCKDIQPGGGRIINCLRDHQSELSDACYDQLAKQAKRKRS